MLEAARINRRSVLFGALVALLAVAGIVALAKAGPATVTPQRTGAAGDLFFTTFAPASVEEASFTYRRGRLVLGAPVTLARLRGADGILFAPDGRILVGGQQTGDVFAIDLGSQSLAALPAGIPGSFHLALSPDGRTLYTLGEPGAVAAIPLSPSGAGHSLALHGDDTAITGLAFGPGGQTVYTASPASGIGNIGLIDMATGTTHRLMTGVGAHGVLYDPATHSYLVMGADTVLQLPARDPAHPVSELVVPGAVFDQGSANGRGQAFLASNSGTLVVVDYAATGRIGDVSNRVIQRMLTPNLDDVAPLVGPGTRPVATDASTWQAVGTGALVASAVLVIGAFVAWAWRRWRSNPGIRRLPRWDRRRRNEDGHVDPLTRRAGSD